MLSTLEVVKNADPVVLLRSLVELDYDMAEAYETAIEMLDDPVSKQALREFHEDHRRHMIDLSTLIVNLGGRPMVEADFRHVLLEAKVFIASVAGDRAILKAIKGTEEEANTTYARAAAMRGLAPEVTRVLEMNLEDERRHLSGLQRALAALDDQDD